jgi:agmatine/peptidylarginine deiminase
MNLLGKFTTLILLAAIGLVAMNRMAGEGRSLGTVAKSSPRSDQPGLVAKQCIAGDPHASPTRHIPGEFERQSALIIACQQMLREAPEVFVAIVTAAQQRVPLIALVADADDHRDALKLLKQHHLSSAGIHFLELPQDTMWIRDYGPLLIEQSDGTRVMLDAEYSCRNRLFDDAVPLGLATYLKLSAVPVPECIDGGNLLSNGQGLALATDAILIGDPDQPCDEHTMAELLKDFYGVKQLVLLEELVGEPTGHVDMFATFVAPNVVVVGKYDEAVDLENAQRLDRNAAKLAGLDTPLGPLQVVRIPMPACEGPTWRSYTNVVFANDALLVPVYPQSDELGRKEALETFARLLPQWKIMPIDANPIATAGGGLHCVTMNMAGLEKLPEFPQPMRARAVRQDVLAGRAGSPLHEIRSPKSE